MHPVAWGEGDVKVEVDVRDDAEITEAGALHNDGSDELLVGVTIFAQRHELRNLRDAHRTAAVPMITLAARHGFVEQPDGLFTPPELGGYSRLPVRTGTSEVFPVEVVQAGDVPFSTVRISRYSCDLAQVAEHSRIIAAGELPGERQRMDLRVQRLEEQPCSFVVGPSQVEQGRRQLKARVPGGGVRKCLFVPGHGETPEFLGFSRTAVCAQFVSDIPEDITVSAVRIARRYRPEPTTKFSHLAARGQRPHLVADQRAFVSGLCQPSSHIPQLPTVLSAHVPDDGQELPDRRALPVKWFLEQLPDASIRFAKAIPMDAKLNGGTTLQVTQFGSTLRSLDRGHLVTIGVSAQPIQRRPVGWQEIEAMSFHDPEQ